MELITPYTRCHDIFQVSEPGLFARSSSFMAKANIVLPDTCRFAVKVARVGCHAVTECHRQLRLLSLFMKTSWSVQAAAAPPQWQRPHRGPPAATECRGRAAWSCSRSAASAFGPRVETDSAQIGPQEADEQAVHRKDWIQVEPEQCKDRPGFGLRLGDEAPSRSRCGCSAL